MFLKLIKLFKKGAYGEVRKAIHKKTEVSRAIKIINKKATSKEDHEKLFNEVQILKQLVIKLKKNIAILLILS